MSHDRKSLYCASNVEVRTLLKPNQDNQEYENSTAAHKVDLESRQLTPSVLDCRCGNAGNLTL
jgi:hypothetical protein